MTMSDTVHRVSSTVQNLPELAATAWGRISANMWWLTLLACAAWLLVSAVKRMMSRSLLRSRLALEVMPTNGFDPMSEDVLRFAKHIARAQRSVSRWTMPARGTAVRVRLLSEGGPLSMRVEGPARAATVLRHQGFPQCEMRVLGGDEGVSAQPEIRLGPRETEPPGDGAAHPLAPRQKAD